MSRLLLAYFVSMKIEVLPLFLLVWRLVNWHSKRRGIKFESFIDYSDYSRNRRSEENLHFEIEIFSTSSLR